MISDAIGRGQTQQQINQKKMTDVVDMVYKKELIQNMRRTSGTARLNAERQLAESLRRAPLNVPGMGNVTLDAWKSLDTKTKAYSYYAFNAKENDEAIMPYNEWDKQTTEPTAHELYELATKDPEFDKWLTGYRKSGATRISIGEKVETAGALADVKTVKYFTDPKGGLSSDINKHLGSDEVQNRLIQYYGEPEKLEQEKIREKESYTVSKIKSAGGKIIDQKIEGRDFVWTVEWPNGKTTEVRVGN